MVRTCAGLYEYELLNKVLLLQLPVCLIYNHETKQGVQYR